MKKRILFWTEYFWPNIGGVEVFCFNLIKELQRKYEILMISTQNVPTLPEDDNFEGIPIKRLPFQDGLLQGSQVFSQIIRKVSHIKKEFAPSVIHVHSILPSILFDYSTRSVSNAKRFLTFHTVLPFEHDKNNYLVKYIPTVDFFSGVSQDTLSYLWELDDTCQTDAKVIHNGLPQTSNTLTPYTDRPEQILLIARLVFEKGIDLGVQAFAKILKKFPTTQLIIAGDGPEKAQISQLIKNLGITNRVDILGWVSPDKVHALMNNCRIVLVPSRWREPFCLVALQAAQMGLPVVATKRGGLPEVVENMKTGILVDSENVNQMADALIYLLKNPRNAEIMGEHAKIRAKGQFSFERMVNQYEEVYERLTA